jgi:multiple sugar transport system permease protein
MSEKKIKLVLTILGIIFLVTFCLAPFVYMLGTSFSEHPDFLSKSVPYLFTTENYCRILNGPSLHFMDYLKNSLIVSGITAFLCVLVASLAGYAITRLALPGKLAIMFFVLAISMFPQISLVGYLFRFMSDIGWVNTYGALVFPYISWTLPLCLWILVSYFSQIPKELDSAGLIDGCSRLKVLQKVILPVAAPGIFSTLLLAFIFAFNEFMFALMLTTDYHARTVPVGIALFQGLHGEIPWGTIMSASVISIIPVVILTIVFQRHIVQGLSRGAVKG